MTGPDEQNTEADKAHEVTETVDAPAPETSKKRGGLAGRLFAFLILIIALLAGAGYGALVFRDKDERIDAVASIIETYVGDARAIWDNARLRIAGLTGEKPEETPAPASPDPAQADQAAETANGAPTGTTQTAQSSESPADRPTAGAAATTQNTAPEAPQTPAAPPPETAKAPEKAPETEAAKEPAPAAPAAPEPALAGKDVAALSAKLEETAELARRALTAAERAGGRAAAGVREAAAKEELSALDLANALEGRIDAIGDELKTLRERLDAPKNETRAAPVAGGASGEAATVVIAFALQKELAGGRPFVDEIAALQRTGADPALVAALAPMAETGAPTGAALQALFRPFEKKIQAEEHAAGQDLAAHILHGASKLVRVRPTGETHPDTRDGYLARIDSALAHEDFAAAAAAFEALPEADRAQAGEFAELLRKRVAAEKAAHDLLHGAIAALGGGGK